MTAYEKVLKARAKDRPTAMAYIENVFEDFIELHGDRNFADDPAIVAGLASLFGRPVTVVGIEKGVDTKDRIFRNFGSAHPEGYRKALRLMKQAEKFHRPVICLVDTSGAYCGIGAEERGQGEAIATNLMEMMALKTPIISIIIGEGGSGGALALAVADQIWMLENAVFSVISPEGAASIVWKDAAKVEDACEALKMTAQDLKSLGMIDRIFSEPAEASSGEEEQDPPQDRFAKVYTALKVALKETLDESCTLSPDALIQRRYEKFRQIGRQI